MSKSYIFSSESVTEGHPDKVSDTISDAILDACLKQDKNSRVACETMVKNNMVVLGGEITTNADFDYSAVVREAIRGIGYTHDDDIFHADHVFITNLLTRQSGDIAQGVDARKVEGKKTSEQGAGDQGLMFGYATKETKQLMPAPIEYSHQLGKLLADVRKSGKVKWLRPDAKTQVSLKYDDKDNPVECTAVVVSTQHSADVKHKTIYEFIVNQIIKKIIPAHLITKKTEFLVNPTGRFVVGGPTGDCGLTGRKIIVDTYGGMGRHGGGAFSGKDPSKVDRSAAYMGRWVAKNIVAAGLAESAEVQFAYAIGHPKPVSLRVDTFNTGIIPDAKIEKAISEVFSFKPADIVSQLKLLRPIFSKTTNYGHFGREEDTKSLTWEATNKAAQLKRIAAKLA